MYVCVWLTVVHKGGLHTSAAGWPSGWRPLVSLRSLNCSRWPPALPLDPERPEEQRKRRSAGPGGEDVHKDQTFSRPSSSVKPVDNSRRVAILDFGTRRGWSYKYNRTPEKMFSGDRNVTINFYDLKTVKELKGVRRGENGWCRGRD